MLSAVSQTALAQAELALSAAERCLTPPPAGRAPPYPERALELKEGGIVEVEMIFVDAQLPPRVRLLTSPPSAPLLGDVVRSHVASFRVPCLPPGQTATLRQDFRFVPDDGRQVVQWTDPRNADQAARAQMLKCLVTPKEKPVYPLNAQRLNANGVVALRLRFNNGKDAPAVQVLDETPERSLIESAAGWAKDIRLPCHTGEPLDVDYDFKFILEDNRTVIKDMPLLSYLRMVKGIREAQVRFNFNEMKCPFDLRIEMRQPTGANRIGQVDGPVPERAFFISWLARQTLELKPELQNRLIGQVTTVSVPCGTLALGGSPSGAGSR